MFRENSKMIGMNLLEALFIILSENDPREYKNDRSFTRIDIGIDIDIGIGFITLAFLSLHHNIPGP